MKIHPTITKLLFTLVLCAIFVSDDSLAAKAPACVGGSSCMFLIDMTANPGDVAIMTNLDYVAPGSKSDTAIDDGIGVNTTNIADFHVLSRDITEAPNALKLTIGETGNSVVENQFGSDTQLKYFAGGNHLFDLERIRVSADWMAQPGNLNPDSGVLAGTYGTLSFSQFLGNIQEHRTMYGFVRVKIPLELGGCLNTTGNCDRNALGGVVTPSDLYGFCQSSVDMCSCAPTSGFKIKEGLTLCGLVMPSSAQIRVKGSLLYDFVASEDNAVAGLNAGDSIPLSLLPWAPRELYFKVEVPIMVNWEFDTDADGAMDNMFNIAAVSMGGSNGLLTAPPITWEMVAPSNMVEYEYYTGEVLTETVFEGLDNASKYHLMMPSGYATGWAEAFDKLNITGGIWRGIPAEPAYGLPDGFENTILTANVVRDHNFEDIPTYLYSGGLIDMHDHVNISGLVYVPQGMELEAKDSSLPTRQYIIGAVVVRDTFYIEAKTNTITVISSDPTSYSTAVINTAIVAARGGGGVVPSASFVASNSDAGDGQAGSGSGDTNTSHITGDHLCYTGCTSESAGSTGAATAPSGAARWIEVRPLVPAPTPE